MHRADVAMLVGTMLLGAAPARAQPAAALDRPAAARPAARAMLPPIFRGMTLDPVAAARRLPAPIAWGLMLGGFSLLGAALRGQRGDPQEPGSDPWRI